MKKFYSSLIINSKNFPGVHQVFRPRYNKEYFRRITANLAQLEDQIGQRCKYPDEDLTNERLIELKENSQRLVKLKGRLEKIEDGDGVKYKEILAQLEAVEDRLMPTVVSIPNRCSKLVPPEDIIIDQVKSDFQAKQNLVKILNHRKLSYINNCYSKSVVGPNSHYYFGIGAKLNHALSCYFTTELEKSNFIPVSGLCLTKSAIVEAVNSKDTKEFFDDPARILNDSQKYTTLHLSEASRESLVGLITTFEPISSNNPLRLMTSGSSYRLGSDWFDGDDKRITQFETVHALVLNSSIEQYSMQEYQKVRDLIWSAYKKLELPARLVQCSLSSMNMNEYDAHRIDIWLPSRQEWIQVSRITHYRDYITIRVGMKRGHIVDSMVYDGQTLAAAIIENRQTSMGKFIIPGVLGDHLTHLTKDERKNYLPCQTAPIELPNCGEDKIASSQHIIPKANVLTNHEQRRYLVKRNYLLSHSRKAKKEHWLKGGRREMWSAITFLLSLTYLIDWESVWLDLVPDRLRSFLYNYTYRPVRRFWRYFAFGENKPPFDEPYSELDKTEYAKTRSQRKREQVLINHGRQD